MLLGAKEQYTCIKSFRRKLERKEHHRVSNDDAAGKWIKTGLCVLWRKAFSRSK